MSAIEAAAFADKLLNSTSGMSLGCEPLPKHAIDQQAGFRHASPGVPHFVSEDTIFRLPAGAGFSRFQVGQKPQIADHLTGNNRSQPNWIRMIAMTDFGRNGRLGNQLFQYAFMRTQAEASMRALYLPRWIGDFVFDLRDDHIRCGPPRQKLNQYREPRHSFGYNFLDLRDTVDVTGFFQSERMFDRELIRRAYTFLDPVLASADKCLGAEFDPSSDLAVGVRLRDFCTIPTHYCPNPQYYKTALERFGVTRIFLFSDDLQQALRLIRRAGFRGQIQVVNASPVLALAAMSRFSNFIIGPSTFHWWGAWLSPSASKLVIVPREGPLRPGAPFCAVDYWPSDWQTVPALRGIMDGYKMRTTIYPVISRLKQFIKLHE
jgi:hypothetical protein